MTILAEILEKRTHDILAYEKSSFIFEELPRIRPSLFETLQNAKNMQIIAEVKRASPSKGTISSSVNPITQAIQYETSGAACVSVLTEPHFFKGSYDDLHAVAKAVTIPVLCKDFIIDSIQIDIAKAAGASVILLIVAAMPEEQLQKLYDYATKLILEVLVEVHSIEELKIAEAIGAKIIGINNRNLKTFEVSLETTLAISKHLTKSDAVLISESGIATKEDAIYLAETDARGLLIGETLMRSQNVEATLKSFQVPFKVGEAK